MFNCFKNMASPEKKKKQKMLKENPTNQVGVFIHRNLKGNEHDKQ